MCAAEAAGLHCPDADHAVANFVSDSSPDGAAPTVGCVGGAHRLILSGAVGRSLRPIIMFTEVFWTATLSLIIG